MKHNRDRKYFTFKNVRTGKTVFFKNGITVKNFMELNRKVNEKIKS
jgi:hypothetical protein